MKISCVLHLLVSDLGLLDVHVDTIKKLTNILVLDQTRLVDISSCLGDLLDVVSDQDKLVFHHGRVSTAGRDSLTKGHLSDLLLTQKVPDLDGLLIITYRAVDGKMGICETHFVPETLGNTGHHVGDVGAEGSDAGNIVALAEPHIALEVRLALPLVPTSGSPLNDRHVERPVSQVLGQSATGSCDGHHTTTDRHGDTLRDVHLFCCIQSLHRKK